MSILHVLVDLHVVKDIMNVTWILFFQGYTSKPLVVIQQYLNLLPDMISEL